MKKNREQDVIEQYVIPGFESRFLDTACRKPFTSNVGLIPYMEEVFDRWEGTLHLEHRDSYVTTSTWRVTSQMNNGATAHLSQMGIDPLIEIYNSSRNESQDARERNLHTVYRELGEKSQQADAKSTRWKRFLHGFLGISAVDYVEPENIARKILRYSNTIHAKCRRGPADFAILNRQQLVYLEESPLFVYSQNNAQMGPMAAVQYVGRLHNIEIYVNNHGNWQDHLVVGRKTAHSDVGVYYCEYDHEFSTYEEPHTGNTKCIYTERCVITPIGEEPHKRFFTVDLRIGKRPLWRRILGI